MTNGFTKEELEEIIESFDWIETETSWEWKHPLRNKIQCMIKNYELNSYIELLSKIYGQAECIDKNEKNIIERLRKPYPCMHPPEKIIDNYDSWKCLVCGIVAKKTIRSS